MTTNSTEDQGASLVQHEPNCGLVVGPRMMCTCGGQERIDTLNAGRESPTQDAPLRPLICLTCDHMESEHTTIVAGATPECSGCYGTGREWHEFKGRELRPNQFGADSLHPEPYEREPTDESRTPDGALRAAAREVDEAVMVERAAEAIWAVLWPTTRPMAEVRNGPMYADKVGFALDSARAALKAATSE